MNLMVGANLIANYHVTINDINAAHRIFGTNATSLKVKTARRQPESVMTDILAVPRQILQLNQRLTISAGVVFVNGIYFVVSISLGINFATVEYVPRRTSCVHSKSLDKIYDIYNKRDFEIELFLIYQ